MKTASFNISRYKSDVNNSESQAVSIYDIKDVSKQDINKKRIDKINEHDGLAVKILRKIPFLKLDEIVSIDLSFCFHYE